MCCNETPTALAVHPFAIRKEVSYKKVIFFLQNILFDPCQHSAITSTVRAEMVRCVATGEQR